MAAAPLATEAVGVHLLYRATQLGRLGAWTGLKYNKWVLQPQIAKHWLDAGILFGPGLIGYNWNRLESFISSSGGGGPGESLISTTSPPSLEQIGKASEHTSSPAAAGNSAHGGRRSGSKPRKKCPPGYRWSRSLKTCIHHRDTVADAKARMAWDRKR